MEQSVESNFFKKFKAIVSLPILHPYFRVFFKKRFIRKSSKPAGHGNLVLITSTDQSKISKLNFNFDEIRTYFLQVLRDLGDSNVIRTHNHRVWIHSETRT